MSQGKHGALQPSDNGKKLQESSPRVLIQNRQSTCISAAKPKGPPHSAHFDANCLDPSPGPKEMGDAARPATISPRQRHDGKIIQ
jgi:hypothetical protein